MSRLSCLFTLICLMAPTVLKADLVTVDLSGNAFTFGAFGGNVDNDGGTFNIDTSSNPAFGGAGFLFNQEEAFDGPDAEFEITFTVGANNTASLFTLSLIDEDGTNAAGERTADSFQFGFSLDGLSAGDTVTLSQALDPGFIQAAFNAQPGDEIQNYGDGELTGFQVASQFGTTDVLDISISSLSVVAIPEPSSLALLGCSGVLMLLRRRR